MATAETATIVSTAAGDVTCVIDRGPLTPRETARAVLIGDGSIAFDTELDEMGRLVQVVRLVLLPIIPPRNERETRRIRVEARTSVEGTKWTEFVSR